MKNKIFGALAIATFMLSGISFAAPAFAQRIGNTIHISARPRAASTTADRIATEKNRAAMEIDNRVNTLNNLVSRVSSIAKLSDSEKSGISSDIQTEIGNLTTLKGNINADNSTTTLSSDMKSIMGAYRIYALVVPQTSIIASSDRINTLVTSLTTIAAKLQTRIAAAQTGGADVSAMTSALSDFNSKVSDASAQATAAASEVKNLAPDNGDKTILASNTSALKDARSKIQTATKDIQTARQDADTIVKALQALNKKQTGTSVSTTTNQ